MKLVFSFTRYVRALRDSGLSPTQRLVLTFIASRAPSKGPDIGRAWPSELTIANDTGLTDRTVRTAVQALAASGWLAVEFSNGKNSHRYTLCQHGKPFRVEANPETRSAFNPEIDADNPESVSNNPETISAEGSPEALQRSSESTWRRAPTDFQPTEEHRELARQLGVDVGIECDAFLRWEFKSPRRDAVGTFTWWLRRAHRSRKPTATAAAPNVDFNRLMSLAEGGAYGEIARQQVRELAGEELRAALVRWDARLTASLRRTNTEARPRLRSVS